MFPVWYLSVPSWYHTFDLVTNRLVTVVVLGLLYMLAAQKDDGLWSSPETHPHMDADEEQTYEKGDPPPPPYRPEDEGQSRLSKFDDVHTPNGRVRDDETEER